MTRSLVDQARDMQENTAKVKRIMDTTLDDPDMTLDTSFVTLGGLLGVTSCQGEEDLHPADQLPGGNRKAEL